MKNTISILSILSILAVIATFDYEDDTDYPVSGNNSPYTAQTKFERANLSESIALDAKDCDCSTDSECEGLDALAPDRCPECFNSKGDWQVKDCDDEKCNKKEEALFQKVFNSEV